MSDRPPVRDTADHVARGAIRVWRARLDRPWGEGVELASLLSADERAGRPPPLRTRPTTVHRGEGAVAPPDRSNARRARGEVAFSYGTRGKPALKWPADAGLEFNLSHSQGLALYATAWRRAVGIDLEYQRDGLDFEGIAGRFFTARESEQILALPDPERRSAFFRGWARKEAFIKVRGDGLWLGLDQFEVSIDPGSPARLVSTAWDPHESAPGRSTTSTSTATSPPRWPSKGSQRGRSSSKNSKIRGTPPAPRTGAWNKRRILSRRHP